MEKFDNLSDDKIKTDDAPTADENDKIVNEVLDEGTDDVKSEEDLNAGKGDESPDGSPKDEGDVPTKEDEPLTDAPPEKEPDNVPEEKRTEDAPDDKPTVEEKAKPTVETVEGYPLPGDGEAFEVFQHRFMNNPIVLRKIGRPYREAAANKIWREHHV